MDNLTTAEANAITKVINILNSYSKECIPADVIKSMSSEIGFDNARRSIESAEKIQVLNSIQPEKLPGAIDTQFAENSYLKNIKVKAIMAMAAEKDPDTYYKYKVKADEVDQEAQKLVKRYENDIDITLTSLKTMLATAGHDTSLIDKALNTKLSAV